MRADETGGRPRAAADARSLGARARDITIGRYGGVGRGREGMSVSPMPPENLPHHRRPDRFGGSGKDPVWVLDTEDLPDDLVYAYDSLKPQTHGFISPAYHMSFEHYQQALAETSGLWELV